MQTNKLLLINVSIVVVLYILSRYYQLQINMSKSMPQTLWLIAVDNKDLREGDYVVIKFHDKRMHVVDDYEYIVKQVIAVEGDSISVQNNILVVHDYHLPIYASLANNNHFNILTTKDILIPHGCYFLHGQSDPSFDSRYKEFGLICQSQIYGKAYPLW